MRTFTATLALVAMLGAQTASAEQGIEALRKAIDEHLAQSSDADTASADKPIRFTDDELDTLLAPVALYPDALLAQVLVAATFPDQITSASKLIDESETLSEDELAARLEDDDWDPSVLVLTSGFPTVVQRMAENIDDTTDLGDAMLQQDEDVLSSVQRLREEALKTGYLADNEAQVVTKEDDKIAIQPKDPQVVYVPSYNPETVYSSAPTASPYIEQPQSGGGLLSNPLTAGAIAFGGALLVQELFGNNNDDNNDDGWDDYWHQSRPIDWQDRQVYARPRWAWDGNDQRRSWADERDRYWDPQRNRWNREGSEARWNYDSQRRDTLGWMVVNDPDGRGKPRVRAIRYDNDWSDQRARQQAARAAAERREERLQEARREDRVAERRAEQRREDRLAEERRQRRLEAARNEARDERKADERKADRAAQRQKQQAQEARQEERAREERQQERQEAARRQERQDAQKAKAEEDRKAAAKNESAKQSGSDDAAKQRAAAEKKASDDKKAADAKKAADRSKAAQRKKEAEARSAADQKRDDDAKKASAAAAQQKADQDNAKKPKADQKKKKKKADCDDKGKNCGK